MVRNYYRRVVIRVPETSPNNDLHPDGERFAVGAAPETEGAAKQDKIVLIVNFFDELLRVAPVTKR